MAAPEPTDAQDPRDVLAALLAGNRRFVEGRATTRTPRPELAGGQSPVAVVLACADSRVAPEIVLDQDLGEIFVVRAAGHPAEDPAVLGSVEYGVEALGARLVLVLGHEGCGAVAAAVALASGGAAPPGHMLSVVEPAVAAVRAVDPEPAATLPARAVREHVRRQAALLAGTGPVLAPAVAAGRVAVTGAYCSITTGLVEVV